MRQSKKIDAVLTRKRKENGDWRAEAKFGKFESPPPTWISPHDKFETAPHPHTKAPSQPPFA